MTELEVSGRRLAGVDPALTAAFVDALTAADAQLCAISGRLESMRVHDQAFGKLIDAAKVRDAYHERLPATERNLAEACAVIRHLAGEFTGTGAGVADLEVVEASVEAAARAVRGERAAASREARLDSEARMNDEQSPNTDDGSAADGEAHVDAGVASGAVPPEEAPVVVDADEPAATASAQGAKGRPSDGTSPDARSDAPPPPAVSAAGAAAAAAAAALIAPRKAVEQ